VKEAAASARTIAHPPAGGPADQLVVEIAEAAKGKEARHDASQHQVANLEQVAEACLADLGGAATALRKLPDDEAAQVGRWFTDIAKAVAAAAKTVTPAERGTIDKIAALFAIPSA
jgi:ABC-type transporter Mla subunit MlaD